MNQPHKRKPTVLVFTAQQ
jgi:hypothetical protein